MSATTYTCPDCGSPNVAVTAEQMYLANSGEHYCDSVRINNHDAKATCLDCNWGGERRHLIERNEAAAVPTQADSANNHTEVRIIIAVAGGCVQSVYGDEMPDGTKLKVVLRDFDNIEAGDPDPVHESYQAAATYF